MAYSYLINASAGSGKTYRLTKEVRKYINIKSNPMLVVAVTFTRAAAAEMQKRILDDISADNIETINKLRLLMRAAKVRYSTIDSLFLQFLATEETNPRIADEQDAQGILAEADKRFFTHPAVIEDMERILIAARVLQISPEQLLAKLKEIDVAFEQWNPPPERIREWRANQTRIAGEYERLQGAVREIESAVSGNLKKFAVAQLLKPLNQADVGCALFQQNSLAGMRISAKDRTTPAYMKIDKIYPLMRRLLAEHIINSARLSSALLKHFHEIYRGLINEEKQRLGLRYFDDITRELLALDGVDAGERFALMTRIYERGYDRTTHFLLDEFQDTSGEQLKLLQPLMEDILSCVAPGGAGERSLFIVGDWKQSIYRWRGADPDGLGSWLAPLTKRRQLLEDNLPFNWRSTPLLIGFFNHLTAELFRGKHYAEHTQNPPQGDETKKYSGLSRVLTMPVTCGKSDIPLFDTLKKEIIHLLDKTDCAPGDIAVLCRTNNHMHKIAGELAESGIAVSGVRGRELLSLPEGTALYLALAALFMPHDGKFIPRALKILGYDDDFQRELLRIKESNTSFMEPLRFASITRALSELSLHFPEVLIEAVWHDAERYFDRASSGAIADWLKHLRVMSPWVTVPEGEHADRIKLATIHSTKGLEFRHVFVLWKEEREFFGIVAHPEDGAPLNLNKIERRFLAGAPESGMQSVLTSDDIRQHDEMPEGTANLLYVAATRAVSSLTWILKADKDGNLKGFSEKICLATEQPIANVEKTDYGYQHDYGVKASHKPEFEELHPCIPQASEMTFEPDEIDPALKSADIEAGITRGLRIHAALARLTPNCALPENLDILPVERQCLERFLAHPDIAGILARPGKALCEQHVSDTNDFGMVDRLIIADDLITIIDYKTGSRKCDLDGKYRAQMMRYRNMLAALYGGSRRIECHILFVDDPGMDILINDKEK